MPLTSKSNQRLDVGHPNPPQPVTFIGNKQGSSTLAAALANSQAIVNAAKGK